MADSSLNFRGPGALARKQGRDGHPLGQTVGDCDGTGREAMQKGVPNTYQTFHV